MDFDLSQTVREELRVLESLDFPASDDAQDGNPRPLAAALGRAGYFGPGSRTGSSPDGAIGVIAAIEASTCRAAAGALGIEAGVRLLAMAVDTFGGPEPRAALLGPLRAGEMIAPVAFREAASASKAAVLQTAATACDGGYHVTGTKVGVVWPGEPDAVAVAASCGEGRAGLFVVRSPGTAAGISVTKVGGFGAGVTVVRVACESCHVAAADVIGPVPAPALYGALELWEDLTLLGVANGLTRLATTRALAHAKQAVVAGKPLLAHQWAGYKAAELLAQQQTAQLLAYRAAWSAASDPSAARALVDCARVFCTETAIRVTQEAARIAGADGAGLDADISAAAALALLLQILGTPVENAKLRIGDDVLRSWGSPAA